MNIILGSSNVINRQLINYVNSIPKWLEVYIPHKSIMHAYGCYIQINAMYIWGLSRFFFFGVATHPIMYMNPTVQRVQEACIYNQSPNSTRLRNGAHITTHPTRLDN